MLLRLLNTCLLVAVAVAVMSEPSVPDEPSTPRPSASPPEWNALDVYRVVSRDRARLRAAPGTDSEVLAALRVGEVVEVLARDSGEWHRIAVEHQGEWFEGWVHGTMTVPVRTPRREQERSVLALVE